MTHVLREVTAIIFALMVLGICLGYLRILLAPTTKSSLVFNFCLSIVLFGALLGFRVIYGSMYGPMGDWLGLAYNIAGSMAAMLGLKAQLLLIPPQERRRWNRFTAWMYPPSGVTCRIARCMNNLAHLWRRGRNR